MDLLGLEAFEFEVVLSSRSPVIGGRTAASVLWLWRAFEDDGEANAACIAADVTFSET